MDNYIKKDLFRYAGLVGFKGFLKGFLLIPGFRYTYFMRKSANSSKKSLSGILYRLLLRRYSFKYGIQIPTSTKIGEGFYIGHFGNIVINAKAVIGKNCNISQGVTIGQANRGRLKGYPIIGDNVWMGANSVIVGNITIGANVMIAPNSYVNFDVPDNSLVISSKCEVKNIENPTEGYINFIYPD